jgi:hypothetical protein
MVFIENIDIYGFIENIDIYGFIENIDIYGFIEYTDIYGYVSIFWQLFVNFFAEIKFENVFEKVLSFF